MATGVACPQPILQFFDNTGRPAVGGSVLTQVGGINTATYQDVGLTTPLPNPIPLNSRGEVSNSSGQSQQLFLTPNTVYTFTLSDSGGNQINQATYVNGIQLTITQASVGGALYPRTAAEIAASVTPTNFQYPELNVLRYGADPTGITDSTAAINQAVSVALQKAAWASQPSLTFNARVYIPTGWYLVGSSGTFISYGSKPILWAGDGPQASMLINGSTNQPTINVSGGGGGQFYGGFQDLGFGVAAGVTAVAGNCAIKLFNYVEFFIRNIGIYNFPNGHFNNLILDFCQQFTVSDVESQGALDSGIVLAESGGAGKGCSYGFFVNVKSDDCLHGWKMGQAHDIGFTNCGAIASFSDGWLLQSATPGSNPNINCRFVNCASDTNKGNNWNINDAVGCGWGHCWGSSQAAGAASTSAGFLIQSANCHSLSFVDCKAVNNQGDGFKILDTGSSAPANIYLTNCHYGYAGLGNGQSGTGYGLNVSATCTNLRIISGEVQNNATGAINFNSANRYANDILVRDVEGYVSCNTNTAAVTTSSSSTVVTHNLMLTPDNVQVTPSSSPTASGVSTWWTSNVGATTFQINTNTNVSSTNLTFSWRATLNET